MSDLQMALNQLKARNRPRTIDELLADAPEVRDGERAAALAAQRFAQELEKERKKKG